MSTWYSDKPEVLAPINALGWVMACARGVLFLSFLISGMILLLSLRLIERPIFGHARPITPFITQIVCKGALLVLGLRLRVVGTPMRAAGAMVTNHISWLDIYALNACQRLYFVAKSEVAGWAGIGWLARATGTVFIDRQARRAAAQTEVFRARLSAGHRLCFFPEGTSSDGLRVLPFKSTLFEAFFTPELHQSLHMQAVSVHYSAPPARDPRFYGWWGDMDFGPHCLQVLAQVRQGKVTLVYHDPVKLADFADRKTLAAHLEAQTRAGFNQSAASAL